MQQPDDSGSHYRNYKETDSIVLMVMVGPEYEFLYVDVGANGRNSDGGIWDQCKLKNHWKTVLLIYLPHKAYLGVA